MTTGQVIDACLRFYLNTGSSAVVEDQRIRDKSLFFLTQIVKRVWKYAPMEFTLETSGTVALTSGVGSVPSDFAFFSKQGSVYTSSRPQVPLTWVSPQAWGALTQAVGQVGTPSWWTLMDTASTGVRQIRTYPLSSDTLTLLNYIKKAPSLIDHPTAPVVADGGAGTLLAGTFAGKVTFVTAAGETEGSEASASVTVAISKNLAWSGIPIASGPFAMTSLVTSRKLYRQASTGGVYKLVTTVADNTTTTYTDNIADGALGATIPAPSAAITGLEQIPDDFHEEVVYEGLRKCLAEAQGDGRDIKFSMEFDRSIRRMWASLKQGQNQPRAFPAYGQGQGDRTPWNFRFLS